MKIAITFTPDGTGHALYTEAIDLGTIGELTIQRATTIEFDNESQYWRVRDPAGFPLFNSPSRQACLDWERQYLQAKEDQEHQRKNSSCVAGFNHAQMRDHRADTPDARNQNPKPMTATAQRAAMRR
jgi:hypothetical protein